MITFNLEIKEEEKIKHIATFICMAFVEITKLQNILNELLTVDSLHRNNRF